MPGLTLRSMPCMSQLFQRPVNTVEEVESLLNTAQAWASRGS